MALAAGSRLGPYEIVGRLGSGGMGIVYRARDSRLDRDVAVKVLPDDMAADPVWLRRFEREARSAGSLNHPNIVTVYDIGNADGAPYVVMELLEGQTLRDRLRSGALPTRKAVEIAAQIANGLAASHERGIVHRDLKPENLFLTVDGRVKILDFGLAQMRAADQFAGSGDDVTGLVFGTYLGGRQNDRALGVSVDAAGNITVAGRNIRVRLRSRDPQRDNHPRHDRRDGRLPLAGAGARRGGRRAFGSLRIRRGSVRDAGGHACLFTPLDRRGAQRGAS